MTSNEHAGSSLPGGPESIPRAGPTPPGTAAGTARRVPHRRAGIGPGPVPWVNLNAHVEFRGDARQDVRSGAHRGATGCLQPVPGSTITAHGLKTTRGTPDRPEGEYPTIPLERARIDSFQLYFDSAR